MSETMATKVNAARLTPSEAWTFYAAIYEPKIYYPSKVTAFRRSDWRIITRKFITAIIRPMGFNSHTARAVVFWPRRYGIIGISPGFAKQGAEGVTHFLTQVQSNTRLGRVMLNTLSQLQLLSGQYANLLSNPRPLPAAAPRKGSNVYRWHHLGRGWLLSLRHYLYEIGLLARWQKGQ